MAISLPHFWYMHSDGMPPFFVKVSPVQPVRFRWRSIHVRSSGPAFFESESFPPTLFTAVLLSKFGECVGRLTHPVGHRVGAWCSVICGAPEGQQTGRGHAPMDLTRPGG